MNKDKLTAALTMGDAAGIGPEVVLKALGEKKIQRLANFLVIGSSQVFARTAQLSKIKLKVHYIEDEHKLALTEKRGIALLNVGNIDKVVFGRANPLYGQAALAGIDVSLRLIKAKKVDVLITAPVNKQGISQTESSFRGHTEYLARATNTKNFAMMLVGGPLKVTLATRHIALNDVAKILTKQNIYQTISLTAAALKKYFGIFKPRIGVCGLNPHCGDKGILGDEESKIILPAIEKAKHFAKIVGPLSADTIFYLAIQGKFDACVAMYHDQGLIPLKTLTFNQGVNLTLGLPFVRTSPVHGTAYDIAGKNRANPASMMEAIKLAVAIEKKKGTGYFFKEESEE